MTHHTDPDLLNNVLQLISEQGTDGLAECLRLLINEAMLQERSHALKAHPYQRTSLRTGHANGFKDKTLTTRLGPIKLDIPQVRGDLDFYPSALEKGRRSEQALLLSLAEMYVQGVSTRKVAAIVEQLCGTSVSSTQVSHCAKLRKGSVLGIDYLEVTRLLPMGGASTTNFYNALGQLTNQIDFKGQKRQTRYDRFGRVTNILYFDAGSGITHPSNTVHYYYNQLGQLTNITEKFGEDASSGYMASNSGTGVSPDSFPKRMLASLNRNVPQGAQGGTLGLMLCSVVLACIPAREAAATCIMRGGSVARSTAHPLRLDRGEGRGEVSNHFAFSVFFCGQCLDLRRFSRWHTQAFPSALVRLASCHHHHARRVDRQRPGVQRTLERASRLHDTKQRQHVDHAHHDVHV